METIIHREVTCNMDFTLFSGCTFATPSPQTPEVPPQTPEVPPQTSAVPPQTPEVPTSDTSDVAVRLVGSSNSCEGRLEVTTRSGSWANACDRDFGVSEAQVVCRVLGCSTSESILQDPGR